MAIIDRITAAQATITSVQASILSAQDDIAEYNQLVADRDAAQNAVISLTTQLQLAQKQSTLDQQAITDLKAKLIQAQTDLAVANSSLATAQTALGVAQAQIASLQSTTVRPNLEYNAWAQNSDSIVGGSGLGAASQKSADRNNGWGEFSITPDVIAGKNNYFDCYYTKTYPPNDTIKNYTLSVDWMLPTAADSAASQCLEMEIRHIIKGGLMFVIACQLDFADKLLRVYERPLGALKGHWITTGVPQARLVPGTVYSVLLEGHRDDTTVFTDQVTINGVVTKCAKSYPAFNDNWQPWIKTSLQLDGMNTPFKAWHRNDEYKVW